MQAWAAGFGSTVVRAGGFAVGFVHSVQLAPPRSICDFLKRERNESENDRFRARGENLAQMRERNPCANVTNSSDERHGERPAGGGGVAVMAHAPHEVEEMVAFAKAQC
jgi:hypothetical protein